MNIDPSQFRQPKKQGMTSVQAAQLYLQQEDKQLREAAQTFDMDALQRAYLRRQMGFDFDVTIDYERKRFICVDASTGYKTTAFYTVMDEKAVKRLVRALMRLKKQHDTPNV